jgi:hypothetical protein
MMRDNRVSEGIRANGEGCDRGVNSVDTEGLLGGPWRSRSGEVLSRPDEVLLHFIWQFRYYNHRELTTEAGAALYIDYPGDPNTNQGPDFKNARITIGGSTLEGPVELHVRASDFLRHGHIGDPHYRDTILHVVWENDTADPPAGIPILVLGHRTPKLLLSRYQQFMAGQSFVPCERLLSAADFGSPGTSFPGYHWQTFRGALICRRLAHRTAFIRTLLDENNPHWEQTLYWLITRSLGQPVNTDAFLAIARSLPFTFLLRRRTDLGRLEALFLDRAARLDPPLFFHRMRPAHSPYTRLRQLAALLSKHTGWFTLLLESDHPADLLKTLDAKGLGASTKRSILINAHIPLLYAYGTLRQEPRQRDKALRWLESTPPEDNRIIRRWRQLGMTAHTAADTQALLELKKNYCSGKKCLDCAIGQALLTATASAPGPVIQPPLTPGPPSPASENLPSPPGPDGYCT